MKKYCFKVTVYVDDDVSADTSRTFVANAVNHIDYDGEPPEVSLIYEADWPEKEDVNAH